MFKPWGRTMLKTAVDLHCSKGFLLEWILSKTRLVFVHHLNINKRRKRHCKLHFKARHFIFRLDTFSSLRCSYVLKIIKYILQWHAKESDTIGAQVFVVVVNIEIN